MDGISEKITSRLSFTEAILVIRGEIVCFKEVSDDGLHRFRVD